MFAPSSAEAFLIVYTACLAIQDEKSRMILHFYFYLGCAEAVARIIPFAFFGLRLGYPFFCSFFHMLRAFGHSTYDARWWSRSKRDPSLLQRQHGDGLLYTVGIRS
jgi:hypothetical protein